MKLKSILYILSFAFLLLCFQANYYYSNRLDDSSNNDVAAFRKDRMDLAMLQEFERTKDPYLGDVPRERLQEAYLYAEKLRRQQQSTRMAIPGITWEERGPTNVGGRTRAILIDANDPTHRTVWTAGIAGGLWKTTDITTSNPSWIPVDDFFDNLAVTTIAQDPNDAQIMYFGTGEGWYNADAVKGDGIWKSIDGGDTWTQLASTDGDTDFDYVQKVVVNSTGKIFAATRGRLSNFGGIMMSATGGASWTRFDGDGPSPDGAADVEIAANGDIYASFGIFYDDGIYKSTNAGASWSNVLSDGNADRIDLACAPSNASVVYAFMQEWDYSIYRIKKTTNGGASWSNVTNPAWDDCGSPSSDYTRGQAWYNLTGVVDPNNENVVFTGGIDLFKSTNGGSSWTQISNWIESCGSYQYVHADQHNIVFAPGQSDTILFSNDGGIYLTTDGTAVVPTISRKDTTYRTTQFYSCAMHPSSGSNYFLAGTQDNGTQKFTTPGMNATTEATGGDGGFCHIDQNEPLYQFTAYVYNKYFRSSNGGVSWTYYNFGSTGRFINPSDYDNTENKLYAGRSSGQYFRWNNPQTGGSTNSVSVSNFGGGKVTAVTVSPNVTNRVYFGLNNGRVVYVNSANTGTFKTGNNITGGGMPSGSVSCIAIEEGKEDHLLVTYSNYGVNSVWESTNGGSSWTSIEGNLPDMPIRWCMFSPLGSDSALVATELGVWSTDDLDGGSTIWGPSNSGLANVRTDMLQWRSSDDIVIASTHGRGLFSTISLSFSPPLPIILTSFNGYSNDNYNLLSWKTQSEIDNYSFEIQKVINTNDFIGIAFVKGRGASQIPFDYEFKDFDLSSDLDYYRLKLTNQLGHIEYSKTISIQRENKNSTFIHAVYPNPFKDYLTISYDAAVSSGILVELIDISGKNVYHYYNDNSFKEQTISISNLSTLKAGTYILTIHSLNKTYQRRLVKL